MPKSSIVEVKRKVVRKKPKISPNGYNLPDPIRFGEVLTDITKKQWKIGNSVGVGGFGEIYLANDDISKTVGPKANYVIKIEPHENGPLFSEIHFYLRVAKEELITKWMTEKHLHVLGMPKYVASGSHEYQGTKYRFMVMERFGDDLQKLFEANGKKFSPKTVLTLGIKILDVLEYIHSHGYIHADIKASNLLLGFDDASCEKVYLVDFGLACRYLSANGCHKEFKEDPRKAHDGTIEFTSRDAHIGVHSRRGDLEILGYNMLQWSCGKLPWEDCLNNPVKVKESKFNYLNNIPKLIKDCYKSSPQLPAIQQFFEHIAKLHFEEDPKYDCYRRLFQEGLKKAHLKYDGRLDLYNKKQTSAGIITPKKKVVKRTHETEANENAFDDKPIRKVKATAANRNGLVQSNRSSSPMDVDDGASTAICRPTPEMLKIMEMRERKLALQKKTLKGRKTGRKNASKNPEISPDLF